MYIQDEGRLSAQLLCQSIERKNKKKAALLSMSLVAVESDYYQKSVSAPVKLSETQARWVGTRATLVYFGRNLCVCMCDDANDCVLKYFSIFFYMFTPRLRRRTLITRCNSARARASCRSSS